MDGSPPVVAALRQRLDRDGAISFQEFMELALYHPQGGLYRRSVPARGRQAHYTTCVRLDPALGQGIALWLARQWRDLLGQPPSWHVIEVGGGDGSLAEVILASLPRRLRWRVRYHMVEVSESAQSLQRERLGRRVQWASSPEVVLRQWGGQALLLSNELVDAFPVALLERRGGRWWEVYVREGEVGLVEELRPDPPWLEEPGLFSVRELSQVPERTRVEVHRSYWAWLQQWAGLWEKGALLTIDYGGSCNELYGSGGPGTLRAYFSNIRLEEPGDLYHRLGVQDLTCDVNFTDLQRWGQRLGWRTVAQWTQREFLQQSGLLRPKVLRPSLAFIASPSGAGTRFRVLWQEKT